MAITLSTILVGMPTEIRDDQGQPEVWVSGFIKQPVRGPVAIGTAQLAGDGQADRTVHGGPEKAILAYCRDHYPRWCAELERDDLTDGSFGENFALSGLDETTVAIGDRYRIGTALVEVSQPRQPCWKLARRCRLPSMPAKAIATGRLGWYFRVIEAGQAAAGTPVTLDARPHPAWTIQRINALFFGPAEDRAPLAEVLTLPQTSPEFTAICRTRFGF